MYLINVIYFKILVFILLLCYLTDENGINEDTKTLDG
jgi:hypothetical protein